MMIRNDRTFVKALLVSISFTILITFALNAVFASEKYTPPCETDLKTQAKVKVHA